jgi:hypothetical protein
VHRERYEMEKFIPNKEIIAYIRALRDATVPIYRQGYTGADGLDKGDKS